MHSSVFSSTDLHLLQAKRLCLPTFTLATFRSPFCAINPPVSNSFHNFLYSFLVILHFCPSISRFLASLARILSLPIHSPRHISPPMCPSLHLPKFFIKYFGPMHFPCIFMYMLSLQHLMHRWMLRFLPFLVHEKPFFSWLLLEFFTDFPFLHQTVKTGCILQSYSLSC